MVKFDTFGWSLFSADSECLERLLCPQVCLQLLCPEELSGGTEEKERDHQVNIAVCMHILIEAYWFAYKH